MKSSLSKKKELSVAGILLLAGCSSRMGFPKPLLPFGDQTLISLLLSPIVSSDLTRIIIVLGHKAREIEKEIKKNRWDSKITLLRNPDFKKGMSTSLIRGISRVEPQTSGIMVLLGDQPFLTTGVINKLIKTFRTGSAPIVMPLYGRSPGHPVIFRSSLIPELIGLTGDRGGRDVVRKYQDQVQTIPIRPQRIGKDMDTWEEYLKAVKWFDKGKSLGVRKNLRFKEIDP